MKVFLDYDVPIDLLLERYPHDTAIIDLLHLLSITQADLYTTVLAAANVHYTLAKKTNKKEALKWILELAKNMSFLSVRQQDFEKARISGFNNFEGGIQHACCLRNGIDHVVTRNIKDYHRSQIEVRLPEVLITDIKKNVIVSKSLIHKSTDILLYY